MNKNSRTILKITIALSIILCILCLYMAFPYIKVALSEKRGPKGPVKLEKGQAGWRLTVGGKPFFIKGVCYGYVPVGRGSFDYDFFADPRRPWMTDGAMMKQMGVNAVRFYKASKSREATSTVIRDLYRNFGIKSALGDYLGYWDWPPPNYADPEFRLKIKKRILEMVRDYKDEEGVILWILGNENNYSFDRGERDWSTPEIDAIPSPVEQRKQKAKIYYTFINDLAKEIKKIDPAHPVVMGNGELASINVAKEYCPNVDILGGIIYQGKSFGSYFDRLKRNFGKPNIFIEFGSDRYDSVWQQEAQDWQAFFLKLQWAEILKNKVGGEGEGNSLGGFIFEWCDEWWKHNPDAQAAWNVHDTVATWSNPSYYFDSKAGNNVCEEWWGLVALDAKNPNSKTGLEKRVPTKAYYVMKDLWMKEKYLERRPWLIPALIFFILAIIAIVMLARSGRK